MIGIRKGPFLAVSFFLLTALTAQDRASIKKLNPARTGSTGLLNLPAAATLRRGEMSLGFSGVHFNREPGDQDFSLFPVHLTVGLHDRLELFLSWEAQRRVHADGLKVHQIGDADPLSPSQPSNGTAPVAFFNDSPFLDVGFGSGPGELQAGAKINLLSESRHALNLAVQPTLKFPFSSRQRLLKGLTNGAREGGYDLIASKTLPGGGTLTALQGYRFVSESQGVPLQNQFNYGIGIGLPTGSDRVQAIGELTGTVWTGRTAETANPRALLDLYLGTRVSLSPQIAVSAAYGINLRRLEADNALYGGARAERSGWFFQLVFSRKINRPPRIACSPERLTVTEGELVTIQAEVADPDDSYLAFIWQTEQGNLLPEGTRTVFDSGGLAPGPYTVLAEVSDGEHSVSCSSEITVRARPVQ